MGTAREPVAGSGDWPAWTARGANWCCLGSDMISPSKLWVGRGEPRLLVEFKPIALGRNEVSRIGNSDVTTTGTQFAIPFPQKGYKVNRPGSCSGPGRLVSRSVAPGAFTV